MHRRKFTIDTILIFVLIFNVIGRKIPKIGHVSLVSIYCTKVSTFYNINLDECLCEALKRNSIAANYFENDKKCQLLAGFPATCRLYSAPKASLYFPQGALPHQDQCCMSNLSELVTNLYNATSTSVSVTKPRCLLIDDHGYLVTVEDQGIYVNRYNATDLTFIDKTQMSIKMRNIAYHRDTFYISTTEDKILVVDYGNFSLINIIEAQHIQDPRDIIFLEDGQILVLASSGNQKILFFELVDERRKQYNYSYYIGTNYATPHGLCYVNDSLFYGISWNDALIYSYSANPVDIRKWTSTLIFNQFSAPYGFPVIGGSHVTIDECGRIWLSTSLYGIVILNKNGDILRNYPIIPQAIFDMQIIHNYIMYISSKDNNYILKIDPQINCYS